jgi:hypothetical protein
MQQQITSHNVVDFEALADARSHKALTREEQEKANGNFSKKKMQKKRREEEREKLEKTSSMQTNKTRIAYRANHVQIVHSTKVLMFILREILIRE